MAKIGLKRPTIATYDTPSVVTTIAKAITANISISVSDEKLYGDDGIAESDRGFNGGTVSLTVTDLSTEHNALLGGHEIDEEGELTAKATDIPPYVKFGFYGRKRVNGVDAYRAVILQKVQFGEPTDDNETKGGTITWGTPTLEGTILTDDTGVWKKEQTFDSESEAIAYLTANVKVEAIGG